jgi:hypothetical protein
MVCFGTAVTAVKGAIAIQRAVEGHSRRADRAGTSRCPQAQARESLLIVTL